MPPENAVIVFGIICQIGLSFYKKLWGGVFGLLLTTFILLVGIEAYASGDGMAVRGTLRLPSWLFYVFVGVYYLADLGLVAVGVTEGQRKKRFLGALGEEGATVPDALKAALRPEAKAETTMGPVSAAVDALDGVPYQETLNRLQEAGAKDTVSAIKTYNDGMRMLQRLVGWGQKNTSGRDSEEWPSYVTPAARLEGKLTKTLRPGALIVMYDGELVSCASDLARLLEASPGAGKVSLVALPTPPLSLPCEPVRTKVKGGALPVTFTDSRPT